MKGFATKRLPGARDVVAPDGSDVQFQFRASGGAPLTAVAVTMPPWPGDGEAYAVAGPWPPTAR